MFLFQYEKGRPLPSVQENVLDFRVKAYYYFIEDFRPSGEQGRKNAFIELSPQQYEDCKEKARKFDGTLDEKKLYENVKKLMDEGAAKVVKSAREMKDLKTGDVIKVTETIIKDRKTGEEFLWPDPPQYENEDRLRFRMRIEKPGKKDLDCPCIPQLENPVYYVLKSKGGQGAVGEPGKKPARRSIA